MAHPLYVAFLWHMHQPYYRDATTGDHALPWVRLHAAKDYLHMAEVLADFPRIHATVNIVPSLIEQLEGYARGQSTDRALRVSLKDNLSSADKEFILSFFFNVNRDRILHLYPPYVELLRQREEAHGDWRRFPDQYWTDLIVWFNLAWFDPTHVHRDRALSALVHKGRDFTKEDVRLVAERSRNATASTLVAYRRLLSFGQVEISTTPYYHPILPLLIDNTSAREATPDVPLPPTLFAYPEDAVEQIRRAILAHERVFGQAPQGMWPAEGAVSQAAADLVARHTDVLWIASDEAILARSIGKTIERNAEGDVIDPEILYQPYTLTTVGDSDRRVPLAIVFRDRLLSDRIGFVYQHMDSRAAAEDLVGRLLRVRRRLGNLDQPHLVPIILDGENCWEFYENNGDDFLRHLYMLLSTSSELQTVTLSEYLHRFPPRQTITHLAAGSWIGGDFLTWIGEPAQNVAWDYLARTRQRLVSRAATDRATSLDVIGQAWRELYIAEGSDWFWWYSSRNNPHTDAFDTLFRGHLAEVYRNLGLQPPDWLSQPIVVQWAPQIARPPVAAISPTLSAAPQAGDAWAEAGVLQPDTSVATMQRADTLLRRFYYGHDAHNLYLRVEMSPIARPTMLRLYFHTPRSRRNRGIPVLPGFTEGGYGAGWSHELAIDVASHTARLARADGYENWPQMAADLELALADTGAVAEIRLRLSDLDLRLGDTVGILVLLGRNGNVEERHPPQGHLDFRLLRLS